MRTVQVGLTVFVQQYSTQWDQLMAASVVATVPGFAGYFYPNALKPTSERTDVDTMQGPNAHHFEKKSTTYTVGPAYGGITASRGHFGDSAGGRRIRSFVDGTPDRGDAPVFGCDLTEKSR